MNHPEYIITDSVAALAERLALDVGNKVEQAIRERGRAAIAVSGGSTPVPFFVALSQRVLDWSRVVISLVDERWVDPAHADSNERLVRLHLLINQAAKARFVGLHDGCDSVEAAVAGCEKRLREQVMPLDVVVLGMGDDGHTASLFPGAAGLHDALDLNREALCAAVVPPAARHPRMTLTLKALVDTRHLLVHITGSSKRVVLENALVDGLVNKAPVAAVFLQSRVPVSVYWAADTSTDPS